MIKRHKNVFIVLLCIYSISLLLGILHYINMPVMKYCEMSGSVQSIYGNLAKVVRYDVDGTRYTPVAEDPQLLFELQPATVSCVGIDLSEPLPADTWVQVYYSNSSELSEEYQKTFVAQKNSGQIAIPVSYGTYSTIRIDIDGIFNIRDACISDDYTISYGSKVSYDFIAYIAVAAITATIIILLLYKFGHIDIFLGFLRNLPAVIKQRRNRLLIYLSIVIAMVLTSYAAEIILSRYVFSSYFIWQRFLFICTALLSVLIVYIFKGKPEKLFLCLSLTIGFLYAAVTPISESGFDDDVHYPWAVQQSSLTKAYFTEADMNTRSITIDDYYNKQLREIALSEKNEGGKSFSFFIEKEWTDSYTLISHIPSGIGIFLARTFGSSWFITFILGRFANLVAYSFIIYFAIKRIKYGKYIISVIGLIPTALFIASNYSYDNWLISWVMLGTAYFLSELQEPEQKVQYKNLAIMLLAFVIGLGPKPVYFPLMFILYFINKDKFTEPKHYRYYIYITTASIALVVASFALPFLVNPDVYTDYRGGDVSSSAQISWILSAPVGYARTLLDFFSWYLSLAAAPSYLTLLGHVGFTDIYFPYMLIFYAAVILTDKNNHFEAIGIKLKLASISIFFICVILVTTALYIAYTPVGSMTVNGVQPRYLLPLLCPLLLVVRSDKISCTINGNVYSSTVFGLSAFFLLASFWTICVSMYN